MINDTCFYCERKSNSINKYNHTMYLTTNIIRKNIISCAAFNTLIVETMTEFAYDLYQTEYSYFL